MARKYRLIVTSTANDSHEYVVCGVDILAHADAYNEYEGPEWLGQHGYGNDRIPEDYEDENLVNLYRLFGAVDPIEGDD